MKSRFYVLQTVVYKISKRTGKISKSYYWLRHVCLSVPTEQVVYKLTKFYEI